VRLAASESSLGVLARRLDEIDAAAARSVAPEQLTVSLSDLRAAVETGPLAQRLSSLGGTLEEVQQQLSQVVERIAELGTAAGELPALSVGMTALRGDVEELTNRLAGSTAPGVEEIAQVVERRVSALLLESEGRVIAHVDDAVLVLAEALLRRRRNGRGGGAAEPIGSAGQYADVASDHDPDKGTAPAADELGAAVVPAGGRKRPAARTSRAPGRPRRFEAAGPPVIDPARPPRPQQEGPTQEGPAQGEPAQTHEQDEPAQPHEPAQPPQAAAPTQPPPPGADLGSVPTTESRPRPAGSRTNRARGRGRTRPTAVGPVPKDRPYRAYDLALEDVLHLLAGVLEVALGLVGLALGLQGLVAGRAADAFLARSLELLNLVLQFVHGTHDEASSQLSGMSPVPARITPIGGIRPCRVCAAGLFPTLVAESAVRRCAAPGSRGEHADPGESSPGRGA